MRYFLAILLSLSTLTVTSQRHVTVETELLHEMSITKGKVIEGEGVVCQLNYNYNNPKVIDEAYTIVLNIALPQGCPPNYEISLPDTTSKVTGYFSSVWVWDQDYSDSTLMGEIHVLRNIKNQTFKLSIDLKEKSTGNRIVKGKWEFKS